ncbi:MAG: hypothetical protein N3A65_03210 [candidate division WOR-3 bacterium]|nr:hypothetical protein [candidate division WOR-3 bacterium]
MNKKMIYISLILSIAFLLADAEEMDTKIKKDLKSTVYDAGTGKPYGGLSEYEQQKINTLNLQGNIVNEFRMENKKEIGFFTDASGGKKYSGLSETEVNKLNESHSVDKQ